MNPVALHYKTSFFLDSERTPRFKKKTVDKAINSAINDIILDRYNNIRQKQKEYAFQTSQRLRDELYTLVEEYTDLPVISGNRISLQPVTDYWLLLAMSANISGKVINTIPVTYDEYNVLELDPFVRPSIVYPERVYRIESSSGVKIIFGDTGALASADMFYIKKPAKVAIGTEVSTQNTELTLNEKVIAYVDSVIRVKDSTGEVVEDVALTEEEEYIPSQSAYTYTLFSGIVYKDFTECDLPDILHEEICRKAAAILSGNVENYNRENSLEKNIKNTE